MHDSEMLNHSVKVIVLTSQPLGGESWAQNFPRGSSRYLSLGLYNPGIVCIVHRPGNKRARSPLWVVNLCVVQMPG